MKEIDTEAPVVWPAWCYSGNIPTDVLKQSPRGVTTSSSSSSSSTSSSSSSSTASDITSPGTLLLCNPAAAAVAHNSAALPTTTTTDIGSIVGVANKFRTKRKSHFTTKQLPTESVDDNSIGQHHLIVEKTKESARLSSPPLVVAASPQPQQAQAHQQTASKAATASLYAEKMLSDRMLLSGYNAIENNKKLCDSSSAYFFLEKVKNETQMESLKDSESINNNNVNNTSSNNNNNNNNNNTNNNSLSSNNPSANSNNNNNNSNIINNNNSNSNSTTSNNSVKRERLSPGTNGDVQFSLSRSRSATPSSFRGTPPQATHTSNDIQLHNLSTNLLSQIQSRSSDFPTRNYSDFMRSLAAKYNNSNPNDSGTSRRSTFFENSKISQTNKSAANNSSNNSSTNLKEQPSPSEAPKSSQNVQNLTTNTPSVPPFVQSFLSSLPFSPGVFPPLIDMSSTQALVTLARAAKEAEIKNILMSAQKRSSMSSNSASQSPGPNLTAALQQAAQFASPALLYSAQLQQQQQQSQNRQSSPMRDTSANSSGEKNMTASPLDLSSAPPTKRFKAESTSSGGSEKSPSREIAPGIDGTVQSPAKSPKVSTTRAPSEIAVATAAPTTTSVISMRQCQAQSDEVNAWSVDDVFTFVGSIDICAEYAQNFRDQCIDGSGLPLLTEDHLVNSLGMKLGPALKLKTMLAKKLGGPCPCVSCSSQAQLLAAAQAAAVTVATSSTTSAGAASSPPSGISHSQNLHPQTNQQQFSVRNSATCNNSSSQTIAHGSCGSSIQRPASAESAS